MLKTKIKNYLATLPKIAFIHIPKCGGVSVSDAILSSCYPSWLKYSKATASIQLEETSHASKLLNLDMMKMREYELALHLAKQKSLFFTGHVYSASDMVTEFSDDWKFLTILRNPVDRFISEFTYNTYKKESWMKNELSISDYLDSDIAKTSACTFARYLTGQTSEQISNKSVDEVTEAAIKNLSNYYLVGRLDKLDEWRNTLSEKLGKNINIDKKNASPKITTSQEISQDSMLTTKIQELCKYDIAIYEAFLDSSNEAFIN